MRKLRIGFLARSFSPQTRSYIPLVIRALEELGAVVDLIHPAAGGTDLSNVRVEHDLYVLKQQSGLALSLAGVLHAQGAAIVNPYPVSLALRDKIVMSRILQAAGVSTPATYVTTHPDKLAPLLEAGPLIVKPYQGTGGYGVDIIESDGTPYVVDMNSFPGFKSVPDAPLRLAKYLYAAAERAARGQPLFESGVPTEAVSTEGAR